VLNGTLLNDSLLGDTEGDTLIGGEGNDRLAGGQGQDTLTGGAGDDVFRFDTLSFEGDDLITDFTGAGQAGGDVIALDSSLFGLSPGALPASAFQSAAANLAQLPDIRIVYDTRDGALYYDEDGSGSLPAVQFATLAGHPTGMLATDFLVYGGSMGLIEE
jgi:Ca2+-binding RTX toxin-like protein